MEETQSRHRKELKTLEGEKRAALKKAKGTKGKKAKEVLKALEDEYETKLSDMKERHEQELSAFEVANADEQPTPAPDITNPTEEDAEQAARERKQEKARRKREAQRQKQKELEEEQAKDLAGPSARNDELAVLKSKLDPLSLKIESVASDGHCLYRAVASQCSDGSDYTRIRQLCASSLRQHDDDFAPFIEYTDDASTFDAYVERVEISADWGGHVELRALSLALKRPFIVYSAQTVEPLQIHVDDFGDEEPIRLSYHLHYYSLGEHYNSVVKKTEEEENDEDGQES